MNNYPDLSVIGVPKAGTTSIHAWLQNRSGVNGAVPKETFFFIDEGNPQANPLCNINQPNHKPYHQFFDAKKSGKTLDSTTHYFYSKTALANFRDQKTKVCVVLREPVGRLISYFNYVGYARSGFKSPIDFSEFAAALLSGNADSFRDQFTNDGEFYSLKMSLDHGNYQAYLKEWTAAIAPENLKVMFFEDMVADRKKFLQSLAEFFELAVEPNEFDDFSVQNEGRHVKYPLINQWLRSASNLLRRLPYFDTLRQTYHSLQAGNKIEFDREQHAAVIKQLQQHYEPLNEQLFEMLGEDSHRWPDHCTSQTPQPTTSNVH